MLWVEFRAGVEGQGLWAGRGVRGPFYRCWRAGMWAGFCGRA